MTTWPNVEFWRKLPKKNPGLVRLSLQRTTHGWATEKGPRTLIMQLIRLLQGIQCGRGKYVFPGNFLPPSLSPMWSFLFSTSSKETLSCLPSHPSVGEVLGADIPPREGLYEMFSCFNPLQSSNIPH